jgi:hypothetical protein
MLNVQFHLFQEAINQFTVVIVLENTNQMSQEMTEAEEMTEVQDIQEMTEAEEMTEVQDIQEMTEIPEMVEIENKQL